MPDQTDEKQPLASEALARDEWRKGETLLDQDDAPGHTLPESERDRATDQGGGGSGGSVPIMPPD